MVKKKLIDKIIDEIKAERERQDKKWGVQNHSPIEWIGILTEEVGEAAKEAVDYHFAKVNHKGSDEKLIELEEGLTISNYRQELIQVAAVAVQMIECIDRNGR